jgi:hypothetical protein
MLHLSVAIIALSACAAVQQAHLNNAMSKAQQEIEMKCGIHLSVSPQEAAAWKQSMQLMEQQCPSLDINANISPAMLSENYSCATEVINNTIKPASYSQEAFKQYMRKREESKDQFISGNITPSQYELQTTTRVNDYFRGAQQAGQGSYYYFTQCTNEAIAKNLPSSYQHQALLQSYFADVNAFARQADKEDLPVEDFKVGADQIWAKFAAVETQQNRTIQAQNSQAWQNWAQGMQNLSAQSQPQNQQCTSLSISPIASVGCQYSCINGRWAEVCG